MDFYFGIGITPLIILIFCNLAGLELLLLLEPLIKHVVEFHIVHPSAFVQSEAEFTVNHLTNTKMYSNM